MAVIAFVHAVYGDGLCMRRQNTKGGGQTSYYHQSEARKYTPRQFAVLYANLDSQVCLSYRA